MTTENVSNADATIEIPGGDDGRRLIEAARRIQTAGEELSAAITELLSARMALCSAARRKGGLHGLEDVAMVATPERIGAEIFALLDYFGAGETLRSGIANAAHLARPDSDFADLWEARVMAGLFVTNRTRAV